jgi:hypothetical protein
MSVDELKAQNEYLLTQVTQLRLEVDVLRGNAQVSDSLVL